MFENESGFVLGLFEVILGYKDKHSWFWGSWTFPLGPKVMKIITFRFFESGS